METYIYLDVLFLRNFFMNLLCLHALCLLMGKSCSLKRAVTASAAGAFWNCVVLITGLSIIGMSFLTAAGMCRLLFAPVRSQRSSLLETLAAASNPGMYLSLIGYKKVQREWLAAPVLLIFIAFCMEGCITWTGSYHGVWIIPIICRFLGKEKKRRELEIKVRLVFRGKQKEFAGFYDSGNQLSEPLTGKMVHLVCYRDIKELLPEHYRQAAEEYFQTGILNNTKVSKLQMYEFTFLSYHSIGKENGQLLGIRMDSADFISHAGEKTEEKVVIGLTEQRLFVRGQDRMIVNGRLEL